MLATRNGWKRLKPTPGNKMFKVVSLKRLWHGLDQASLIVLNEWRLSSMIFKRSNQQCWLIGNEFFPFNLKLHMLLIKKNCTINIDIKHLSSPSETKILFVFIIWLPNVDIITKFHLSLILLVMSKLISKKWVTLLSIRILSHISGESIQYWYKFIFKILTSRLSKDLTSIISPMENGFVAGRWIGDIILICHEIIHYLSVRYHCDTLCMTLKLDMRKHMIGMANFKPTQTPYLSSLSSQIIWYFLLTHICLGLETIMAMGYHSPWLKITPSRLMVVTWQWAAH